MELQLIFLIAALANLLVKIAKNNKKSHFSILIIQKHIHQLSILTIHFHYSI
jgi:hypothetical protein